MSVLEAEIIEVCRHCGHVLDQHVQLASDGHDCQVPGCACERGCCFEERCPKSEFFAGRVISTWGGNPLAGHTCCICYSDDDVAADLADSLGE